MLFKLISDVLSSAT